MKIQKLVAAFALGALAISLPTSVDARRLHEPNAEAKAEVNRVSDDTEKMEPKGKVGTILKPGVMPHSILRPGTDLDLILPPSVEIDVEGEMNLNEPYTGEIHVPQTVSRYDTSIIGTPMATQQQCVQYLLKNNPNPRLSVSAEEIVQIYYEEAGREGIRPDVAFAQALKETGFFRYGGDVVPEQNNYCGLGTTGGGVKGEYFSSARMGVRAHIQHLLAYSSTRRPTTQIIDPRYQLVRQAFGSKTYGDWQDLNGRWAVPGKHYGQEILSLFKAILMQ